MGPHTFNFALAAELAEQAGAALRAPDLDAGVGVALGLLGSARRDEMARAAVAFAAQHRGAAARMAEAIDGVLMASTATRAAAATAAGT
jgi:3-deoxy-D-manno-octulosonic-acid transferase